MSALIARAQRGRRRAGCRRGGGCGTRIVLLGLAVGWLPGGHQAPAAAAAACPRNLAYKHATRWNHCVGVATCMQAVAALACLPAAQ